MKSKENFRQAATLILVRNTNTGIQVYMTERPGTQDFPGLHVFPGGKVDAQDHLIEAFSPNLTDFQASEQLNLESGGLSYWAAAIRESFEEANVLMANSRTNAGDTALNSVADKQTLRSELRDGQLSLSALCENRQLDLATDKLKYFAHWITPATAPRRYDARFFVCDMPFGQTVAHDINEVASALWIGPREALARYQRKEWAMIDPTLRSLEVLVNYASSTDLFADIDKGIHLPKVTDELSRQGMQVVPQYS